MTYVLGVDGGGSKTIAALCDDSGVTLGWGVAGCGNHQRTGLRSAMKQVRLAYKAALQQAGLQLKQVSVVQYALAGADRPKDYQLLRPALDSLTTVPWNVVCDTMAGLRMGSADNTGIVLVCGSGTNAVGRDASGLTVQVGGFGRLFGDGTGGYDIARDVFRSAIRSYEGRDIATSLTERIPTCFGQPNMQALVDWALDEGLQDVPMDLTRTVHRTAQEGDELSGRILERAGQELGLAATAVFRRLQWPDDQPLRVILVGSVLQQGRSAHLLRALKESFNPVRPAVEWIIPDIQPVYGAVMLAMDHLGLPVTDSTIKEFKTFGGDLQ